MMERGDYEQKLWLFVLDMVAFFVALNGAIYLRYGSLLPFAKGGPAPWERIFVAFPFVALVWLVAGAMFGSYRARQSAFEEVAAVVRATLVAFLAVLSVTFFYRGFSYSRGMIGFLIPLVLLTVIGGRLLFRAVRRRVLRRFGGRPRVAILGRSKIGNSLLKALLRERDYYDVVGVVATTGVSPITPDADAEAAAELPLLGHVRDIEELCRSQKFEALVLVERHLPEDVVLDSIEACLRHQVSWNMIPAVHELLLDRARVDLVDGIPLVGMRRSNIVGFNWAVKRLFDIALSLALILLASPLMAVVALAIKLSSKGPIFYVQQRIGYHGRAFPFYKFRSMHRNNDDAIHREYTRKWIIENKAHTEAGVRKVHKITDDPRVFKVGRFIRKYSIDELPQLFNVLGGEMSLIGPRPALPYEVEVYREWHRRRFEAPPGITGLWQVSGRNQVSFEEMVKLDIDYLENWSLLLDLRILVRTVRVVLFEHAY
ncbi:MAG: sugar transferase [Deltaproteobacteria bacterium]|nr:sugar transferase [Deltaproteobacteria bacterium]